jgi:tetratricopeptide (TPR) repeat protein
VLLLRAMVMFFAPPAFGGDQERGFQHWQDAIALLEKSNTADPLEPEWGLAEAWGWLGGAYLMRGDTAKAVPAFERALDVRRDFWWVSKIALPQAKRPGATAAQPPRAPQQQEADAPLYSVLLRWAGAVWTAVTTVVQTILAVRASL